jgi:hypothetical protein
VLNDCENRVFKRDLRASEDVNQEVVPTLLFNISLLEGSRSEVCSAVTESVDEELGIRKISSVLDLSFRFRVINVLSKRRRVDQSVVS